MGAAGGFGRAIGRLVRNVMHLVTFGLVKKAEALERHPGVMSARYDEIIRDRVQRIRYYKDAVARIDAQQERAKTRMRLLLEGDERSPGLKELKELKEGAAALAQERVEELRKQGMGDEEMMADTQVLEYQSQYEDYNSTFEEKQAHYDQLEVDSEEYAKSVDEHMIQLKSMSREIEKLKAEKGEAVADVITAGEEKEIADMLSGIQQDGAAGELASLRETRQQLRSEARVSKKLAGTDMGRERAKLRAAARRKVSNKDFMSAIGVSKEAEEAPVEEAAGKAAPEQESTLPE